MNPFDQFDAEISTGGISANPFDQFDQKQRASNNKRTQEQNKGVIADLGTDLKRGVLNLPSAATGLLDIPVAAATGRPMVSEGWDGIGKLTGFQPGKWAKEAENEYSDGRKQARQSIDEAWKNGTGLEIAKSYIDNPSQTFGSIAESIPLMLAGGFAGRAALWVGAKAVPSGAGSVGPSLPGVVTRAVGEKWAPAAAAGIGEGSVMAGQSMSDLVEKGVEPRVAAGYATAIGGTGGLIGVAGGQAARRLGVVDPETIMTGGVARATTDGIEDATKMQAAKEVGKRMIGGGISEGVLEELPQSLAEKGLSNLAQDKPFTEDLARAGVEGTLAGTVMGAGFNVIPPKSEQPEIDAATPLAATQKLPDTGPMSRAANKAMDSGAVNAGDVLGVPAQEQSPVAGLSGAVADSMQPVDAGVRALADVQRQPATLSGPDRVREIETRLAELQTADPASPEVAALAGERDQITAGWPQSVGGAPTSFSTESGARLDARYALMDASQVVTSHDEQLRPSPSYPKELQPMERDRAASEMQISGIAQRLDPARMGESADSATGAPIVGADGLVESGNARSIALKRVYRGNPEKAAEYRQFLQENAQRFGLDPQAVSGMQNPVLVRVRETPVDRVEFARQANASTVAQMSPSEQARADAGRLDTMDDLQPTDDGDFMSSRDFIRRFVGRLPGTEQAGMMDANGQLSQAGYTRVRNAILAKAYGDSPVLTRMVESLDDNLRNVGKALMRAAPDVAKMRADITDGALFEADITPDLLAGVETLSRLKDEGRSISEALSQADMLGGGLSPEAGQLLAFMDENIRRPRRIAEFIQRYTEALRAAGNPNQGSLLGETQAPSKRDIINAAWNQANESAGQIGQQQSGQPQGNPGSGQKAGEQRGIAQGGSDGAQVGDAVARPETALSFAAGEMPRGQDNFNEAAAELGTRLSDFSTMARMVPEKTPDLMPTLVRLFKASAGEVGSNPKDLVAHVKQQLKARPDTKAIWNKISDDIYRKAARQALPQRPASGPGQVKESPRFSRASGPEPESERQFKETERAYGGRDAYDRAKANGKTKLNYRQWVQVRTPKFKEWFGDWEAAAANASFNAILRQVESGAIKSGTIIQLGTAGRVLNHFGIPPLKIEMTQSVLSQHMKKHGISFDHLRDLAAHVQAPIAVFKSKHSADSVILLTEIQHPDGDLVVALQANRERNRLVINDIRSIHPKPSQKIDFWIDDGLLIGVDESRGRHLLSTASQSNSSRGEHQEASDVILFNTESLRNASKVVDQETGEPLVVYHGTNADFDAFDNAKTGANDRGLWGKGHYFTSVVRSANSYAERQGDGAQVIPAFASLKNPLILTTGQDLVTRLPDGTNYRDLLGMNLDGSKIKGVAQSGGHDGVVQIKPDGFIGDLVAYTPTQIKSATGNNGDFAPANPDIRRSFAGQSSATADKHALSAAQDRLNAGEDAETVRKETGWFRGVDGRFRYEISDADASVDFEMLGNLQSGGWPAFRARNVSYRDMGDGRMMLSIVPVNAKTTREIVGITVPDRMLNSILPDEILAKVEAGEGREDFVGDFLEAKAIDQEFDFDGFNALPLDHVLDHQALFAAYPGLKDVMVQIDKKVRGASFSEREMSDGSVVHVITLGAMPIKEFKSALLHEIQHGIQTIEGFATGGAIDNQSMPDAQDMSDAMVLRNRMDRGMDIGEARSWFLNNLGRAASSAATYLAESNTSAVLAKMPSSPRDRYTRLAGEVEARNTQSRMNMTDAERRATPPSQTADVADSDVIVVFNGKEMSAAPVPANATKRKDRVRFFSSPPGKESNAAQSLEAALRQDDPQAYSDTPKGFIREVSVPNRYAAFVRVAEQITGVKIVFVESADGLPLDFDGAYVGGRTLYVNRRSARPVQFVVGHEFTHYLKQKFPKIYEDLEVALGQAGDKKAAFKYAQIQQAMYKGKRADLLLGYEELYSDTMGDAWADPKFWQQLSDRINPKLLTRIRTAFANFMAVIKDRIARGLKGTSVTAGVYQDIDAVREAVLEATTAAALEKVQKDRKGGLKFSKSDTITVDGADRPTRNSNGQPIHPTEEGVRNFWRWFGDSKVVDDQGRPLVVYHGTGADFSVFDLDRVGQNFDDPTGFFFTNNTKHSEASGRIFEDMTSAGAYAKNSGGAPNIMAAYIRAKNPKIVDGTSDGGGILSLVESRSTSAGDALQDAMDDGFDALIVRDSAMLITGAPEMVVAVASPTQIKSATGNTGDFDVANPDIRFSRGSGAGMAIRDLSAVVDRVSKHLKNLPKVHVLESPVALSTDDPAQKSLRDFIRQAGAWNDVEGATHEGEIYLFASGLADEARAEHVLAVHEVTHYGLRGAVGEKRLDAALQEVWAANARVRKAAAALKERFGLESNVEATEEVLADMRPGDLVKLVGWRRVVKVVRDWLSRAGFERLAARFDALMKAGMTDQEKADVMVADLVTSAREWVRNGKGRPFMGGTRLADGSLADDLAEQEKWLTREAKVRGFKTIDELSEKNYQAFESLAKLWREKHQVDGALLSRKAGTPPRLSRANTPGTHKQVRGMARRADTINAAWEAPEPTRMDDFIYTLQNKHVDMHRVASAIDAQIGKIEDAFNPYLQEELFHGRAAKGVTDFLQKEMRPLLRVMRLNRVSMTELEKFLHARHAPEANAHIAKINPDNPGLQDGGSGMTNGEAAELLAGIAPGRRAVLDQLAGMVDAMNASTRKLLVDAGLESKETVAAWEKAYKFYVPLQREDAEAGGLGIGQGYSVRGSSSKRRTGSTKAVVDILANIALQRERTIVRAEKNRVSQANYALALKAPNPDFWMPVNPDAITALSQKKKDALVTELEGMGLDAADAQAFVMEPMQRYVDPRTGTVAERINPVMRNADNVLTVRVNGKDRFVFYNRKDERAQRMVHALKNLDADQLGGLLQVTAKFTRYLAAVNTQYNPVFGVVNLTRDVQGALLQLSTTPIAGAKKQVLRDVWPAMKGIYVTLRNVRKGDADPGGEWAALWEDFQRAGGRTGYRDQFSNSEARADALRSELNPEGWMDGKLGKVFTANGGLKVPMAQAQKMAGGLFGWLSDYNDTLENGVRLAAYKAALDKGMSKQQAASVAKNLTVNFNRKGQVATQAGALYAFFNAAMQGSTRMAQTLAGPAGKRIILGGLTLGAVQALALALAGFDDEEPPQFVRERSLIIPIGDGKYVSIPMPLGYHVIPGVSRVTTEWALSGFRDTAKRFGEVTAMFADSFNPIGNAGWSIQTIAPSVVDPLAALAENRDWTGKNIAREDFNSLHPTPGYTRAKDTASELSKAISYWANLATGGTDYKPGIISPTPDQIDYLIGQLTGGVGRESLKLEQTAMSMMTGEELPPHKIPLFGRFYGDSTGQSSQANRFYSNLREINLHRAEIDGRSENGGDVDEYIRDNPVARLAPASQRVESMVRKLRAAKREALKAGDSDQVKMADARITELMQQFNEQVAAVDGGG